MKAVWINIGVLVGVVAIQLAIIYWLATVRVQAAVFHETIRAQKSQIRSLQDKVRKLEAKLVAK